MIRRCWSRLLRGGLPLTYLLLSACGGGGDGGGSASNNNLVSKDLPWRIPSKRISPTLTPLDRVKPGEEKATNDEVMKAEDIVVPDIVLPDDISPEDAERQLAERMKQPVAWGACESVVEKGEQKKLRFYESVLGNAEIQCARVQVPLNYGAPLRDGSTELKLLRISIGKPSGKRHLLFNPGGPGANGLFSSADFAVSTRFLALGISGKDKQPEPELVQLAKQMIEKYVFVGFSPRGSAEMLPVQIARGRLYEWSWETNEGREERRLEKNSRAFGAAFASNANAPYVHTDAVTRDMNFIRHIVGDEQLHFYGGSYGTKLGLWYAGRFPKHTGRMLLEAVVDYEGDPLIVSLEKAGPWLRNFIKQMPYAYSVMDSTKFFPKNQQDIDITQILDKLDVPLQHLVMDQLHTAAYRAHIESDVYDYLIAVLLAAKYFQEGQTTNQRFSEDAEMDRLIKAIMARFGNLKAIAQYQVVSQLVNKSAEGLQTYWCNDARVHSSSESLRAVLKQAAGPYYLADIDGLDSPCAFWPFKRKPFLKPTLQSIHAAGADRNLLMLNAEWDRATVMSGAEKTRKALPDARFIKYLESTKHGFFPTESLIVDRAVYRHFVEDRLPDEDIEEKATVFDELIGTGGDWIRDPKRDPNERLPFDLFEEYRTPSYAPFPRSPYSRQ